MIALGWTTRGAALPPNIRLLEHGDIDLLVTPIKSRITKRDIMAHQAACLSAGLDLLPTAAAFMMRADMALKYDPLILADVLADLSGMVQVSISAVVPNASAPAEFTGRSWLKDRTAQHAARQNVANCLQKIGAQIGARQVEANNKNDRTTCDLLLPRQKISALQTEFASVAGAVFGSQAVSLTVTGPWPAYTFAKLPQGELV